MKRSILIVCSAILLACTVNAQQTPWTQLPATKTIGTASGREITFRLKLDTLHTQEAGTVSSPYSYEKRVWYDHPSAKVGYGYMSDDGRPFGIWRYYTVTGNTYELFAEGYVESLSPAQVTIDEDIIKKYGRSGLSDSKSSFIENLEDKTFFTGEWRFYKNGKLNRIINLDRKVRFPLEESLEYKENGELAATRLTYGPPSKIRLAGIVVSSIYFSPNGLVSLISGDKLDLEFGKDGKLEIEPLGEEVILMDYLQEYNY
jgi:hypothetical protein